MLWVRNPSGSPSAGLRIAGCSEAGQNFPMPKTINVLFLAAEADPFIKVGGLGDVAGSLPAALRSLSNDEFSVDVRLAIPFHPAMHIDGLRPLGMFNLIKGETELQVETTETTLKGVPVYLIGGDLIRLNGSVYSSDANLDAEKYAFFSLAALEIPKQVDWFPHILHANDWHTALCLYGSLARRWDGPWQHPAGLLSVHNLPFLGPEVGSILEAYGIKVAHTDLPEWARTRPLPLGLWAADAIVAVSPSYAEEIMTPEYGSGLNDFLQARRDRVSGIVNGLDVGAFDPAMDDVLVAKFDSTSLSSRSRNKLELQKRLGFTQNPDIPLVGMVSRMDVQKGVDLALSAIRSIKGNAFQAIILGTGDSQIEKKAQKLEADLPGKFKIETRFDAKLARQIYAGADMLLMPSRYEPCGLSQMIAMRYGCVPVVRAVGGLKDTIQNERTGFTFQKAHHLSLKQAMLKAFSVYAEKGRWVELQRAGMEQDFSWAASAARYLELYKTLLFK